MDSINASLRARLDASPHRETKATTVQDPTHYDRIARAIEYIHANFKSQPTLNEIAAHVHLSPAHFQRLFTEWAGTSPKKFLQYISLEHAKALLKTRQGSVMEIAFETGLSSTSRLHDLFVHVEGMTPAEYRNGGADLRIHYSVADSPFGTLLIASTPKGICHMAFEDDEAKGLNELKARFPNAMFQPQRDPMQQNALAIFNHDWSELREIKLHLKGTAFQLKVWESLLTIPMGSLRTYGDLAEQIGQPSASRAVGTAIGSNAVAFLIPCHRVIQATGHVGGYKWGPTRKTGMIGWEAAQTAQTASDTAPSIRESERVTQR